METRSKKRQLKFEYESNQKKQKTEDNSNNDSISDVYCTEEDSLSTISEGTEETETEETFKNSNNYFLSKIINKLTEVSSKSNNVKLFEQMSDKIEDGTFFDRRIQNMYSEEELERLNKIIQEVEVEYKKDSNMISIIDILNMNISNIEKGKLLERYHIYVNSELFSDDYVTNLEILVKEKNKIKYTDEEQRLEDKLRSHLLDTKQYTYKDLIIKSKMSYHNKVIVYQKLEVMNSYETTDIAEYTKYKKWMDMLLSIPFDYYIIPSLKLNEVRETLDNNIAYMERAKDQIINLVCKSQQLISDKSCDIFNGKLGDSHFCDGKLSGSVNAIGLEGPKGCGKTSIAKAISRALHRPLKMITLGGESDVSQLSGNNFTYIGSNCGRIIEILRETNCMNPIIFIDELDKISKTHLGKEIIGTLIHLTDTTTNNKYNYDRYFNGIQFDLSKVLFIFTYNDHKKVDKILLDRLYKIKLDNYKDNEKLHIVKQFMLNQILEEYNLKSQIEFKEDILKYLIKECKTKSLRELKGKLEVIISRINTLIQCKFKIKEIIKLEYAKLGEKYNKFPIIVNKKEDVDLLLKDSIENDSNNISKPPEGMYT